MGDEDRSAQLRNGIWRLREHVRLAQKLGDHNSASFGKLDDALFNAFYNQLKAAASSSRSLQILSREDVRSTGMKEDMLYV